MFRNASGNALCLAEERRIMYVAASRARDLLFFTWPATEDGESHAASVFLSGAHSVERVAELTGRPLEFLQQMSVVEPSQKLASAAAAAAAAVAVAYIAPAPAAPLLRT
jgi:superfamily I DNA/RNA helicase